MRVLIVDDDPRTRELVDKILDFEQDITVVGLAATGEKAIEVAQEHQPEIVLIDINMPGIDGFEASQRIVELVPNVQIVIMSVQSDFGYMRRALKIGVGDFLVKPFGGQKLVDTLRAVYEKRKLPPEPLPTPPPPPLPVHQGVIVTIFSPKGGSGCTTVAVNLAVALADQGRRTLLLDGRLQFGDVSVMLNIKPHTSILDLVEGLDELDAAYVESVVSLYQTNLMVLPAPKHPEMADMVTGENIKELMNALKEMVDLIIVDTSSSIDNVTLGFLDQADKIVLVCQQDLPSLKGASQFYELAERLEYEEDKIWLVVNKVTEKSSISVGDVSKALKRPVIATLPEDERTTIAANQGVPIITHAKKRPLSAALTKLADQLLTHIVETQE